MHDFDDDNRGKFSRERQTMRSDMGDRNRYSTGSMGMKRGPQRRDDEPNLKRSRFENAADSYDPQFNKKNEESKRAMLTFKKFCETQDDQISDEDAIAKYNDYKLDFRKQEYEKFFQAHKDEEWFQLKYHPDMQKETNERNHERFKKRLEVFTELTQSSDVNGDLRFDFDNCENIIRFMDAVVIKLEDGTNEDVQLMLKEPIVDESLDDLRKKNKSSNGSSDQNGGNSTSSQTNGVAKNESATEESEELTALLKRVPYKTHSIFFRNIGPGLKIEDIEAECKNYPGYLRLGLSDPIPEQNFTRRLWISFRRDVRIKDIFWNMKNAKFAEGDTQASVNRDLRRRIRTVNGISNHRQVVQNDIRQAARLVALYDYKRKLFADDEEQNPPKDIDAIVGKSKNPVLDGVFEYFVEETNAEEEELLGVSAQSGEDLKFPLEVDKQLNSYLDKLLLYLRVVHSIDYYNHCEYANEDSMPNRMGMVHVRDAPLNGDEFGKNESGVPLIPKKSIDLIISNTDERLKAAILKFEVVSEDDLNKLGKKDLEQAVEAFIEANCVEVSKDKWLCPLSGKKFKGPEFIRKHLQSKHEQKLEEARAEAAYFNNYISDPDRPHNPEPKPQSTQPTSLNTLADESRRSDDRFSNPHRGASWNDRPRYSGPPRFNSGPRGSGDFGGRNDSGNKSRWVDDFGTSRRDPRQPPNYRDLDAPEDVFRWESVNEIKNHFLSQVAFLFSLKWTTSQKTPSIFFLAAILLLLVFPFGIYKSLVRTQSKIQQDSDGQLTKASYYWSKPPADTSYDFYLFNILNDEDVTFFGATPQVQEFGPYSWKQQDKKGGIEFKDGEIVKYDVHKTWVYNQNESCETCSYDDTINLPNLSIAVRSQLMLNEMTRLQTMMRLLFENEPYMNSTQLLLANLTPLLLGIYPFKTVKMREVLFVGYTDALIDFLQSDLKKDLDKEFGNLLGFDPPPIPLLGYFAAYNDTTDGQYTAITGKVSDLKTGLIQTWRNMSQLPWWKSNETNNLVDTTDGALSGLFIKKNSLRLFQSFLCRHLVLDYKTNEKVEGIPTYRFEFNSQNFNPYTDQFRGYEFVNDENINYFPKWNGSAEIKNWNLTDKDGRLRLPPGFVQQICIPGKNVSLPFTALLSPPHFLNAPYEVIKSIIGLSPNAQNHSLGDFYIQPTVGSTLKANVRSQLNIAIYKTSLIT
ncbi:Arsenite-resistance protein 2-like protein [Aphelenchoides besseyi]|nr:Arsenite-resistance protein 2-like protein [Aphelenchoides besseyi]